MKTTADFFSALDRELLTATGMTHRDLCDFCWEDAFFPDECELDSALAVMVEGALEDFVGYHHGEPEAVAVEAHLVTLRKRPS